MTGDEAELGTVSEALTRTGSTFIKSSTPISGDTTSHREHCLVENGYFEAESVTVGADVFRENTQVLLSDGNNLYGLCTVVGQAGTGDSNFYMATKTAVDGGFEGRFGSGSPKTNVTVSNRWSTSAALHAIAEPASSLNDLTTSTANKVMEFGDRTRDANTRSVLYAAPHPFETGSFDQVKYIHDTIPYQSWDTIWAFGAKNQSANADAAFHITATDISGLSFPRLGAFMPSSSRLPYAVAFHGFSDPDCVDYELKIGGGIETTFRRGVGEIITEYIGSGATPSSTAIGYWDDGVCPLNGGATSNFINRVTKGDRGLQLEQRHDVINPTPSSSTVRDEIAAATKSVYDCLVDTADDSGNTTSTSYTLNGSALTYGTTGVACPRWIGDITLTTGASTSTYSMTGGVVLDTCEVGAHAHVDLYKWSATNSAWTRIGGGRVEHRNVNGTCKPVEIGWGGGGQLDEPKWSWRPSASDLGSGTYRAVIRATRASGAAAKAFFRILAI